MMRANKVDVPVFFSSTEADAPAFSSKVSVHTFLAELTLSFFPAQE